MNKPKKLTLPFPNDKFIKAEKLRKKGFSYYMINRMVEEGILRKVNGTTYEHLKYQGDDHDFLYVSGYIDGGVVCLMSAAVYHGLSSFRPYQVDVAIKQKQKVSILPNWPTIQLYYFSDNRYNLGVQTIKMDGGNVRIYNEEKTVCDLLTYRNKYGIEDCLAVLKNYLKQPKRDLDKLLAYAEKLRVKTTLMRYLEVLL